MFLTTHLAPNVMIGHTIASGVILTPKILREYIALKQNIRYSRQESQYEVDQPAAHEWGRIKYISSIIVDIYLLS